MKTTTTYIRNQTHDFHLVHEEESILHSRPSHGPNDKGMESVAGWLHPIKHHIIVHVPKQEMPTKKKRTNNNDQ